MNDDNEIYNKIEAILNNISDNYTILEHQIDVGLQMEYFDYSRRKRTPEKIAAAIEMSSLLGDNLLDDTEKKEILANLAGSEDVAAYRIIERFAAESSGVLQQWAYLALQESRMVMESNLLEESQIFISTGLGGKGRKLRFFAVLVNINKQPFSEVQQKIIRNELDFALPKAEGELETLTFERYFCTILVILPLKNSIKDLVRNVVRVCNEFGGFISNEFLVTNVKVLNADEIVNFLENDTDSDNTPPNG